MAQIQFKLAPEWRFMLDEVRKDGRVSRNVDEWANQARLGAESSPI